MNAHSRLADYIHVHPDEIGKVVDFDESADRLYQFDFSIDSLELDHETLADVVTACNWINKKLSDNHSRYGIGGYMEHRTIYARSSLFDTHDEPRRLHLGVDIWADAGTPVYSPLPGIVHSFNNNNSFGDYGPTIILTYELDGLTLYALYGHLSRENLSGLYVGQIIQKNQQIANFGTVDENGGWPPHLHFQLMFDMEGLFGDYPGVCRFSEKDKYLKNIPNPQLILQFPVAVNR